MKKYFSRFLAAIFIIFTILTNTGFAQDSLFTMLMGNWESVKSHASRLQSIQFKKDSTVYIQTMLAAEYSYSVSGDRMITKLLNSDKTIIDTFQVTIKRDTVISTLKRDGDVQTKVMVRMPGRDSNLNKIEGNYTWVYPNGHIAFSKFTNDGIWIFRLPIETFKGKFNILGDSLIITNGEKQPKNMKFWIKDSILIITENDTGNQVLYKIVDYSIN